MLNINMNINGLNDGQKKAIEMIINFLQSATALCAVLAGYAGTGKTFTLGRLSEALEAAGIPVAFVAPTNKACVVMRKNGIDASTVHKFLYEYKLVHGRWQHCLRAAGKEFHDGLVIMDESSMATDTILNDLEDFARRACCKVLYVGDPGQLPAVGKNTRRVFSEFKDSAMLTRVMRQAGDSRILDLATAVRNGQLVVPSTTCKDVAVCSADKAFDNYIQKLQAGADASFICWTNAKRVQYNKKARAALGIEGKPKDGEKFIAINNSVSYANGEEFSELGKYVGTCNVDGSAGFVYEAPVKGEFRTKEDNRRFILVLPEYKEASFGIPSNVDGEYDWILFEKKGGKRGSYYVVNNDIELIVATFAYAITGHKSQGSQWDYVYVDEVSKYSTKEWYYTVLTRAVKGLVLTHGINLKKVSWQDIEVSAYGKATQVVETKVEAPVQEAVPVKANTVPKKWTITYHENYSTFEF